MDTARRSSPGLAPMDEYLFDWITRYFMDRWETGLSLPTYPLLDHHWQSFCADQHDAAVHCPNHPRTRKAYRSFCYETDRQFRLLSNVIHIELWPKKGEPYQHASAMREDVRTNRHLWVFPTGDIPSDHPLAQPARPGWLHNDTFRAVHDLVTHAPFAFPFNARGEEAAYHAHEALYPPDAYPALCAETRMQSAWFFFGAHLRDEQGRLPKKGSRQYIPPRQRPYSEQKAYAAPEICISYNTWRKKQTLNRSTNPDGRVTS